MAAPLCPEPFLPPTRPPPSALTVATLTTATLHRFAGFPSPQGAARACATCPSHFLTKLRLAVPPERQWAKGRARVEMKPWVPQTNIPLYLGAYCDWRGASSHRGGLSGILSPPPVLPGPAWAGKGKGVPLEWGVEGRQSLGEREGPRPEPNLEAGRVTRRKDREQEVPGSQPCEFTSPLGGGSQWQGGPRGGGWS